jgi:hypothetical protein
MKDGQHDRNADMIMSKGWDDGNKNVWDPPKHRYYRTFYISNWRYGAFNRFCNDSVIIQWN